MPPPPARLRHLPLLLLVAATIPVGVQSARPVVEPAALQAEVGSELFANLLFRTIGPATMSGRIVDLAVVESDPYVFYAATATGGVWKTTNNGVSFTPVFEREAVHSIGAVAVHQQQPDHVWVGTGEAANRQSSSWGDGVYRSTDGGATWTNMGLRDTKHIGRIALHPTDPNVVFVAALGHLWGPNRERGLFKSIDGGTTWRNVLFVDEDTGVVDVAIDPQDPTIMYAAAYQRRRKAYGFHGGGSGSGLYASTDAGNTWRRLRTGLPDGDIGRIGISIYRTDPRIVYVCVEQGVRYNASTAYEERRAGIYRSEDRGDSWTHMSDWNPRPMYASQIRVDPSDEQRIYMMNTFSYSDDGGKTFTTPRQSLHGDDRLVWIDPDDSRHLIKGDDGGLGISYDRGDTWLYVTALPVSQFYRIDADMRDPFWVYGGLQDNGSWAGPSATYTRLGIRNEDWIRTGGGDGFFNVIDRTDNRTLYTASQYLGLSRLDLVTQERQDLRPGDPQGHIQARRNWASWGQPGAAEPELGNAMAPANWDAPIIISPHAPRTIYAGTNVLWRSTDRGETWTSLGDRTTGVDRATLTVMGQRPDATTLSLDDGIPYYPTLTAIAESPLRAGLLYVGTDDGSLQVSRDGGKRWATLTDRLPGLPPASWVSDIEPSRHAAETVYVSFDNHRNDDYANYLYASEDGGSTWRSLAGGLPPNRVIRAVVEDPTTARVLYLGTELGLFASIDQGARWFELTGNLPRVAVNDLLVHPRDNDLVLGTHGRGIWILDNLTAIQGLDAAVLAGPAHVFPIERARQLRLANVGAHTGDMIFRGENPPAGAIIDYYLASGVSDRVQLSINDESGQEITTLDAPSEPGIQRVIWNLRYPPLAEGDPDADEPQQRRSVPGPLVVPGRYVARLRAGDHVSEQTFDVSEDPRLDVEAGTRTTWTEALVRLAALHARATELVTRADALSPADAGESRDPALAELARIATELRRRIAALYEDMSDVVSPPTRDQRSRLDHYRTLVPDLEDRIRAAERP